MKKILHFGIFIMLLAPAGADATTWYVKQGASGAQNGTSWTDAFATLQPALGISTYGDTIWVAKGTYYPVIPPDFPASTNPRDRTFLLRNGVKIFGGFAGTEASLSARAADSVSLHVTNAAVLSGDINSTPGDSTDDVYHVVLVTGTVDHVLDGFTVTRGNADGTTPLSVNGRPVYRHYGGGIYSDSAQVIFRNLAVTRNAARSFDDEEGGGGGMFNYKGNVEIARSAFVRNHAENCNGGGMKNLQSSPRITDVYFGNNTANTNDEGGGGLNNKTGSNAIITNTVFEGNATTNSGGGIYNDQSSPQLTAVLFRNNTAGSCGGGMDTDNGSHATLTHVIFHGNTAHEDGGGLFGWQSSAILEQVSFVDNHAGNNGGGMYNYNTCNPKLTYVTFTGNTADNDYGGFGLERNSHAVLTNVLISRNTAVRNGGGIGCHDAHSTQATLTVTNATIVNNTAPHGGGGYDQGTTSRLRNSIIAGNYPDDVDVNLALVVTSRNNIVGDGADLLFIADGSVNPNGINVSWPVFVDTALSNYRLIAGSPAIDSGDSSFYSAIATPDLSAITQDLRGAPRTIGAQTDLGAFEFCTSTVTPSVSVTHSKLPSNVVWVSDTVTFTATAVNAGANPVFEWRKNGVAAAGAPNTAVWVATAWDDFTNGDKISVKLISSEPCAEPDTAVSNDLEMQVRWDKVATVSGTNGTCRLYPNPNKGVFTIEGSFTGQGQHALSIADATGRKLYHETFHPAAGEQRRQVSLPAGITPGVYFLSLEAPQQPKQVIRFVMQ